MSVVQLTQPDGLQTAAKLQLIDNAQWRPDKLSDPRRADLNALAMGR